MLDLKRIVSHFSDWIGFKEEPNFNTTTHSPELFKSKSSLFFNGVHPLVTFENIRDACPNQDIAENPADMSKWIIEKRNDAIKNAFAVLWQRKKLHERAKTVLKATTLFSSPGNIQDKEVKQNRFVGYQLALGGDPNVAAVLNEIGLQFTHSQDLDVYIYNTSSADPIEVVPTSVISANGITWADFDIKLTYIPGSVWFIGYYEEDLTGQAINRADFDFVTGGCKCSPREQNNWADYSKILRVSPFSVKAVNTDRTIWDITKNEYHKNKSFGLNFSVSGVCDLTNLVCKNPGIFTNMIYYHFGVLMLHEFAFSTRNNHLKEKLKATALWDLDDRENGGSVGLKTLAANEVMAVDLDFSGLSGVCLPSTKSRIHYRAI